MAKRRADHGAVRDIGIIAGILDDSSPKPRPGIILTGCAVGNFKIRIFAAWRDNCDAIRKLSCHHRRVGCIDGGGGTGTGRPPEAELGLKRFFPPGGTCHVPNTCRIDSTADVRRVALARQRC